MGWFYSYFTVESKVLVGIQFNALLLDTGRSKIFSTFCKIFKKKTFLTTKLFMTFFHLNCLQVNFIFLLNIIRVLVVKLRQSRTSEVEQVRKAVRAAVVLVPLLGLTNCLNMSEAPLDRSAFHFACWSYSTHFMISFQGCFISVLYCFYNGEVEYLKKNLLIFQLTFKVIKSFLICFSKNFNPYRFVQQFQNG